MKKITLMFLVMSYASFAQEFTYMDFGVSTNTTTGNWNNIAVDNAASASGITLALIDSNGTSTGATLTIDDAFNTVNTGGNPDPDASLPFPSSAAADSFFGSTTAFQGATEPTGGFTLTGLDPTKFYSFSIFASRNNVTDIREAQYTLVGSTTSVVTLNASNNTTETADVANIQSDANGEINFTAEAGPNNNNGTSMFYYLGSIEMIMSDAALSVDSFNLASTLNLYPNPVESFMNINFDLSERSNVNISVFDATGKLVASIYNDTAEAGTFSHTWNRYSTKENALDSGLYILKITAGSNASSSKLLLK